PEARFDKEINIDASTIDPMITYGTNPGMGIAVTGRVPALQDIEEKKKIYFVFIVSCTNSRIEDLRMVASFVKGKQKAKDVEVWIVPGSKQVELQAKKEGIDLIFENAGFQLREPGCSAC